MTADRVVSFVLQTPRGCDRLVCTTCGGSLHFLAKVQEAFPDQDELVEGLRNLTGADVAKMRTRRNSVRQMLDSLPEESRIGVVTHWLQGIENDPRLARAILLWTHYGRDLPPATVYELLSAAERLLVHSRRMRDDLRKSLPPGIDLPFGLKSAIEEDIRLDEEESKAAAMAAKARQDYLSGLSRLSFPERVSRILADESIGWQDWRSDWSICTDEDLEGLEAAAVQSLIDLCAGHYPYRFSGALKMLYDRRHQLRLSAMEGFRCRYGQMTQEDQLRILIRDTAVPIESYPAELSEFVTPEWLALLPEQERDHFDGLLSRTRLRVWQKVGERCRSCE